jgi:hypothetical protein
VLDYLLNQRTDFLDLDFQSTKCKYEGQVFSIHDAQSTFCKTYLTGKKMPLNMIDLGPKETDDNNQMIKLTERVLL